MELYETKNEVHLSLGVFDFDDGKHDEITQSLGIEPDKQFFRGKPLREDNPKHLAKCNVWRCNAPAVNSNVYASFDEQADTLFKLLNERKDVLKVICDKYYCELSCGVYIYTDTDESTPSIHLSKEHNALIKELNIAIAIDIILLSSTNPDK